MFYQSFSSSPIGKYVHDLYVARRSIYISIATGLVTCFVYIHLMSAFAETISWICIILMQIGFCGATYVFWQLREDSIAKFAELLAGNGAGVDLTKKSEEASNEQMILLGVCIAFGAVAMGFFCCICCAYESLKFAIDVIDASADFLAGTKRIILVPALYFFLTIVSIFVWAGCLACVVSLNDIKADPLIPQSKDFDWTDEAWYMSWYMLFGILWFTAWLEYTSTFIVLVSATTYYFNSNAEEEGTAEVALGFEYAYCNHPGSIAVGAFIIAIIRFIRIVFVYAAQKLEKQSGNNPVVKYAVRCAHCILACLEKICDYLNEAAYAYMAVTGDGFCTSAWNGFLLNVKHMLKFAFANTIAKVFIFIGKIAITVCNMFLFLNILKLVTEEYDEVSSLIGPMAAVAVITYTTASLFLGLFDDAVMALMTCLAIDLDLNDGTPQFGPPTFHDRLKKVPTDDSDDDSFDKVQDEEQE